MERTLRIQTYRKEPHLFVLENHISRKCGPILRRTGEEQSQNRENE